MIDANDLHNRTPRPPMRVPCKVLKFFEHDHTRLGPGDKVLLHRLEVARLAEQGLVEVIVPPLDGFRKTVAL